MTSNYAENVVRDNLEAEGWTVLRKGWPDFCAIRGESVRFIEVKGGKGSPTPEQRAILSALRSLGFPVEVMYVGLREPEKGEIRVRPVKSTQPPPQRKMPRVRGEARIFPYMESVIGPDGVLRWRDTRTQ